MEVCPGQLISLTQHMFPGQIVSMNFTNIIIRQVFTETAQFIAISYLEWNF